MPGVFVWVRGVDGVSPLPQPAEYIGNLDRAMLITHQCDAGSSIYSLRSSVLYGVRLKSDSAPPFGVVVPNRGCM